MHSTFDEDTNFNNQEETIGELRDTCKELRADVAHKDKVIEQYSDEARKLFAELTELRTAAQQALEAIASLSGMGLTDKAVIAITTLTAALESKT